jgi:hypothetical protein
MPEPEPETAPEPAPAPADSGEPELTPFSLEELGLSAEEIAALNAGDEPTAEAAPEAPAEPEAGEDELGVSPFSFDDLDMGSTDMPTASPEAAPEPDQLSQQTDQLEGLSDLDIEPFSLDELGLGTDVLTSELGNIDENKLGLTEEELAGFDLGDNSGGQPPAAATTPPPGGGADTGDKELDNLINLGQRQGFVELIDIINVVHDPEEEADRIEEIAWALHHAGIEIRDRGEVIDMEAEMSEEDEEYLMEEGAPEQVEPEMTAPPAAEPDEDQDQARPTRRLSASELSQDEPEVTPLSLEELGLSPEEIAALNMDELSGAPTAPEEPEAAAPAEPEPEPEPADSGEPELTPFSLEELGLSAEEIAALNMGELSDAPAAQPEAASEPEAASNTLGLTDDEIARLGKMGSTSESSSSSATPPPASQPTPPPAADTDLDAFDFDLGGEDVPPPPVKRTEPKQEEEKPEPTPEDLAFEPESLDSLDDVWDAPDPGELDTFVAPEPAEQPKPAARERPAPAARERRPAGGPPPRSSRGAAPPRPSPTSSSSRPARPAGGRPAPAPTRGRPASPPPRTSAARPTPSRGAPSKARSQQPHVEHEPQFYPTGNEALDTSLQQLENEPDNHGLRLGIARMGMQSGQIELAAHQYRHLIRQGDILDQVADDITAQIAETEDGMLLHRLHRLLGDCYSRQQRYREAMQEYSWTLA